MLVEAASQIGGALRTEYPRWLVDQIRERLAQYPDDWQAAFIPQRCTNILEVFDFIAKPANQAMNPRYTFLSRSTMAASTLSNALTAFCPSGWGIFSLVVLENGSTDGTREWLAEVRDPRITVCASETLLPIEQNWARALTCRRTSSWSLLATMIFSIRTIRGDGCAGAPRA